MHGLRNAILTGEGASQALLHSGKEHCRRRSGATEADLSAPAIERSERRTADQRRENRHFGIVGRAMIGFRRKTSLVRVVNISGSGLMIESDILPQVGERIGIAIQGFAPAEGTVRWVRQGRIGIDVGPDGMAFG